ncbi:MAG: TonB-dependent receptor [Pseudomonadota bacterium]
MRRSHPPVLGLVALLLPPLTALAQTEPAERSDPARDQAQRPIPILEDILVTATKTDTSLQDLDVAATVIDRKTLLDARVTDIRRIDDLVPNVQFNDRGPLGAVYISIRGVESNPFIVNRAAVYIDGIPFRELNNSVLTQLEHVEVLRGPQSTLYGANTETGLIVINTKAPSTEFEASTTLTASSYPTGNAYQLDGLLSGALVNDTLLGSVSFRYSDRDLFLKNIGDSPQGQGQIEEAFLQARLRWEPTDQLTVNATAYVIDTSAPGVYPFDGAPVDINRYNQVYSDGVLFDPTNPFNPPPFNGDLRASSFKFVSDASKQSDLRDYTAGLSIKYTTSVGDIDFASSYRSENAEEFGFDADLTNGPLVGGGELDETDLWSAELRFSSLPGVPFSYSLGASFYSDRVADTFATLNGPGGIEDYVFAPAQEVRSDDFGLFGSVSYSPLTLSQLTATLGLRYDVARRETIQTAGVLDLGFAEFVFDQLSLEDTFEELLPRLGLRYEANDYLTVYSNIAKGYLPGGFNITAALDGLQDDVIRFASEEMWSYEVGAKWSAPEANLYLAAATFFIDIDDYQEFSFFTDETGQLQSTGFITSLAAIESYGFEIEGFWEPLSGLTITANLGVVNSEYTDFGGASAANVIGNPVKLIPSYDGNVALRYESSAGWFVRGEVNFLGDTPLDEGNRTGFNVNAVDTQPKIEIFGLQLGYATERLSTRLFVENATNERRISGASFPSAFFPIDGIFYASVDAPRTVGIELMLSY